MMWKADSIGEAIIFLNSLCSICLQPIQLHSLFCVIQSDNSDFFSLGLSLPFSLSVFKELSSSLTFVFSIQRNVIICIGQSLSCSKKIFLELHLFTTTVQSVHCIFLQNHISTASSFCFLFYCPSQKHKIILTVHRAVNTLFSLLGKFSYLSTVSCNSFSLKCN